MTGIKQTLVNGFTGINMTGIFIGFIVGYIIGKYILSD